MNNKKIEKDWKKLRELYNELSEIIEQLKALDLLPKGKDNVYENMHKLSSKLGKQIDLIDDNCLIIKETQWEKLKRAGIIMDSFYSWHSEHKEASNLLWSVINKAEGVIK